MKQIMAACTAAIFLLFVPAVHAQYASALSVSPVIYDITLSPGKTYRYELKIKNSLDAPMPLRIELENLDISQKDETGGSPLRSIVSWVEIADKNMIVEPRSERVVPFSVHVPDKVPLGGYYGMMYLRTLSPIQSGEPSNISSKIGILLMGSIGVQEIPLNKIYLLNPQSSRPVYEGRDISFQFSVKNTALNHFSAKPFLRIRPLWGKTQDFPVDEKIIFPGRIREWKIPVTLSSYPALLYEADLTVSVGGGAQQKARLYFIAFPFMKALLLLAGVLAGGIIIKNRKRIGGAVRILIHG